VFGGPQITYTGQTTVSNGVLALSNTTAFVSPVTINGGQLLLGTAGATTFAAAAPTVTNNATEGIGFTGGNAFTLPGLAGTGSFTLWSGTGGGVTLTVGGNNANSLYSGVLSDAGPGNFYQGSLVKAGNGTLTLTGTNTYAGPTTLSGGSLYISSDVNLGQPHNYLVFNGGNLRTTNSFTLNDRNALLLTTTGGFSVDAGTTLTVTNAITGPGALIKTNAGTLVLSAVNAYTNFTAIQQGTLQLGVANAIPSNSVLFLGNGLNLTGTLDMNGLNQTIAGLVTPVSSLANNYALTNSVVNLSPGQSLNVVSTASSNVVFLGTGTHVVMSGGGAFNVNDPNGSMLIYGRSNNVAAYLGLDMSQLGDFSASVSNITVGFDNNNPPGSRLGLLALASNNVITANTLTVGSATMDGSVAGRMFLGQSNTLNVANLYLGWGKASGTLAFSNGFSNGQLTLAGTNGTRANVYLGEFNQSGSGTTPTGTLILTNMSAGSTLNINQMVVGDLAVTGTGGGYGTFLFDNGTVDVNTMLVGRTVSGAATGTGAGVLTVAGGVLNVNSNFVIAQKLGAAATIATGTVNLAGGRVNSFTDLVGGGGGSALTLSGGTLDMTGHNLGSNGVGFISNLNFQAGALLNVAQLNNGAPLVKTTAGTLVLSNNAYTGGTTNLLGTLAVGGNSAFGSGQVTMNGGTLGVANGGNWTVPNTFNMRAASSIVDTTGGDLTLAGVLTNTGALVVQGTHTLLLTASNTYGGNTTVSGGTLALGADATLPANNMVYVDTAGTFDIATYKQTIGGLQGSGAVQSSAGGALTVHFSGSQTFLGTLNGPGSLTLTGGGTMSLTGTNSFSGGTAVSNATYVVNGLHNGAVITAYNASTVGGSGPISTLNVLNGGLLSPGAALGLGTQTVHSLTLNPGGLLAVGLTAASNGLVRVDTTFAMTNAWLKLDLTNYAFVYGTKHTLVDYTSSLGFDYNDANQLFKISDNGPNDGATWANLSVVEVLGGTTTSNMFFRINYDDLANGESGTKGITLTAIPEPGTASLLGLVGLAWLVRRIRRRRSARG
jgi:autotransporter-associated beta strand protein